MAGVPWQTIRLPQEASHILRSAPSVIMAGSVEELIALAVRDPRADGIQEVAYDVPGKGRIVEALVCRVRNGISCNYPEPAMRRRDPDCMVIGDEQPTNKKRYRERFNAEFEPTRLATFDWLKTQDLVAFPFVVGGRGKAVDAMAICPANAGFFALALAKLQGILPAERVASDFAPKAIVYIAPPFRHTHFEGKQVVVHNRREHLHELFSYNLYPGPSAKKGIYGVLLTLGEHEKWLTAHCSTVQVVTPYDREVTFMHEGASGSGKSEMLENVLRQRDGRLLLGLNLVNAEERFITLPRTCELHPVTDDMALCHPLHQGKDGKLTLTDAEDAWFVRVNHIKEYGTDPHLEALTVNPPRPLLFFNIDAVPGSRALIWDHIQDSPGKACPNPRVVIPRDIVPHIVDGPVPVDIRSFGVRCPPCTKEKPSYGILGFFHVLPPALAWLWRLVAPRGHENPSVIDGEGMGSEGVGSYWPFATGKRVDQANLLLEQIRRTPQTRYILVPNQHVGAWRVGFMPQWIAREYFARRGSTQFKPEQIEPARCPLLGHAFKMITVEGQSIANGFLRTHIQPEVGEAAYDAGAKILFDFFQKQLSKFQDNELDKLGRQIIHCCLASGTLQDYYELIPAE